jgi:glycosyltransferase involved in cell wall biosynthesis
MRIRHFCFSLDPTRGGVPSGLVNTVQQLTKFGIENQIFSFGNTKSQIKQSANLIFNLHSIGVDYKYTFSKFRNEYGIGTFRGLDRLLLSVPKPDLVVLHQIYTFSTLFGFIYAKRFGIPYAVMPHGSLTKYHESDNMLIKTIAKWLLISKILRKADAIIVTCESEKADLNPALQKKVVQLEYGAVRSRPVKDFAARRTQHPQTPHIVFSGRFDKKKNLPLLIKAMPIVLEQYPELILDIAGSGSASELSMLRSQIKSLNLEGNIQFHGWIDAPKMLELFSMVRLLVLPSENENFAIVVAEALSAGVPCVVSKHVGTADIVAKHHAGEIIQELTPASVAEAILKVLQGDETKYRAAAIEAVDISLEWSKVALRWKELVSSLA